MSAPTPVQTSARTYYGVQVVDVGEEGDMLILGHRHSERRIVAALNAHARYLGYCRGDLANNYEDAANHLDQRWAQLHTECCGTPLPDPEHPEAPCPDGCDDLAIAERGRPSRQYEWCADWYAKPEAPGAFPVVVWRA